MTPDRRVSRFAADHQVAVIEPDRLVAEGADGVEIVRHDQYGGTAIAELLHARQALLLERVVADGEKLVATGTLNDLRDHADTRLVLDVDQITPTRAVLKQHGITGLERKGPRVTATVPPDIDGAAINRDLVAAGVQVRTLIVERPSLEEYFVELTGEGFDVAG